MSSPSSTRYSPLAAFLGSPQPTSPTSPRFQSSPGSQRASMSPTSVAPSTPRALNFELIGPPSPDSRPGFDIKSTLLMEAAQLTPRIKVRELEVEVDPAIPTLLASTALPIPPPTSTPTRQEFNALPILEPTPTKSTISTSLLSDAATFSSITNSNSHSDQHYSSEATSNSDSPSMDHDNSSTRQRSLAGHSEPPSMAASPHPHDVTPVPSPSILNQSRGLDEIVLELDRRLSITANPRSSYRNSQKRSHFERMISAPDNKLIMISLLYRLRW
jgi:hypothetical protein